MQVSVDALNKGTFDKYDKEYKQALVYARASIVPNEAYSGMIVFTDMIEEYMQKNWLKKIFSPKPYNGFSIYRNNYNHNNNYYYYHY